MNVKKMFSKIILAGVCMLGALGILTSTKAATESELFLGLERYRNSGYGYQTNFNGTSRTAWKISSYGSGTVAGSADKTRTFYCVKAGPGFGSGSDMGTYTGSLMTLKYKNLGNLKNLSSIGSQYTAVLPTGENYNSLVWVLDHCYVPAKSGATQTEIEAAEDYKTTLLNAAFSYSNISEYEYDLITDDQIDVAQQLAIWYFTNTDNYKITDYTFSLNVKEASDANYMGLGDKWGTTIGNAMTRNSKAIFRYLVDFGLANAGVAPTTTGTTIMPSISINSTNAQTQLVSSNYIAGPYTISAVGNNYDIIATLKNGNTDLTYSILDSNKQATTATFKDLAVSGAQFYLSIPSSQNIEGARLTLKLNNNNTLLTYWNREALTVNDQPVVEVERTTNSASTYVDINTIVEGRYRIQLVKVNEENLEEKLPGAQFTMTVDGANIPLTVSADGTTFTSNYIEITDLQADTLKIVETVVPTGYTKLFDELVLDVIKEQRGNKYYATQIGGAATHMTCIDTSFDSSTNTIIIKVKNKPVLSGEYTIKLVKVNEDDTTERLSGAQFTMTRNGVNEPLTVSADGATFTTNTINIDNLETDSLRIVETVVPSGFEKLFDTLDITVIKQRVGNKYVASQLGYSATAGQFIETSIDTTSDNIITIKVKNRKKVEGSYRLKLVKVNESMEKVPGAQFTVTRGAVNVPLTVSEDGATFVTNYIDITATGTDTYKIVENSAPLGYEKLIGELTLTVTKDLVNGKYELSGYSISDTINVQPVMVGDELRLFIKNKEQQKYNVELVKVDSKNTETKLPGAVFTMNLNGTNKTLTTSDDGTTFTSEDIYLSSIANDVITITETTAPTGYDKLIGNLVLTVTKTETSGVIGVSNITLNDNTNATAVLNGNKITIYVLNEKQKSFDLALRKYILKINGTDVETSRVPVISSETIAKLAAGEITTLSKVHPKNALLVEQGDTVLYEIRVYNEGTADGYVKEITDYLPVGLKLKENSTINETYGWTVKSSSINQQNEVDYEIVSKKLKDTLINGFDGTNVDSKYVQVECVVTATESQDTKYLRNIAEITAHADINGTTTVIDVDSTPKNLTTAQRNDYNPGTSTQGWGYEDDDDYEELVMMPKVFDLALRKFITNINGVELKDVNNNYVREPNIDASKLNRVENVTTAEYKHAKNPIGVKVGDIVIYTIRIYNEGDLDGYVSKVTDYLPPELEFVTDDEENFNASYGWVLDSSLRKVTSSKLSKEVDAEDNLIEAFDKETMEVPDYVELKIKCRVKSTVEMNTIITNIAEITEFTDANGDAVVDRDSEADNITLPVDENLPDYKGNTSNKSILTDSTYHYKGQQDDDDFEKLTIEEFDLALRKFITGVNKTDEVEIALTNRFTDRIPVFTKNKDENGNYIYEHSKEPVEVSTTDIVEYTIRIFNEGNVDGYASLVKDDIPSGLEFLPENELNTEYRWVMLDEEGNVTENVSEAKFIQTDYLSKAQDSAERLNLLKAFNEESMLEPDHKDVKVNFKVIAPNSYEGIITNIAQISDDSDENGNPVVDIDSTPDNDIMTEDDIDVEHIKLSYFDLALRKFITKVDEEEIDSRIPVFKVDEDGKYVYEHTKEPVEVVNGNVVTYTLRVYNEGTKSGYAELIKDDIPEGLEFLPENETNIANEWVMLDEDGNVTDDVTKAVSIATDHLSFAKSTIMVGMPADYTPERYPYYKNQSNLLLAYNPETMTEGPDHLDVEVAFKVTEPNTSDRIIINQAQIADDIDEEGNDVVDIDSTPDKWIDGEDDQDIEKIRVKYFDLALRKWVTQAIVISNGKEVITETGHKAEDDPEEVVKVEIVESKLNKVVVKFKYKIRVTNEGEIPGYVDEISDYIPEGLKFVKADNPNWKEKDGKVVTDALKDTLLNPGESAEVEIVLTWINDKNNLGLKVNTAEISKDRNDSNSEDIDSTPNNKKDGEDDIDDAPVLLSIKTGAEFDMTYLYIATVAILIVGIGVIFIKKYVL